MADGRAVVMCDGCGQVDDHPKHHYGVDTYHHDCIPHRVVMDMTTEGYNGTDGRWVNGPDIPENDIPEPIKRALKIRELAMSGTRGPALLKRIEKMHEGD